MELSRSRRGKSGAKCIRKRHLRHGPSKRMFAPDCCVPTPPTREKLTKRAPRRAPFEPAVESLRLRRVLRHDANPIVDDLEKPAFDMEARARTEPQITLAEQGHHRCVPGEDADLAVEGGGDDGIRRPLEQHPFRRATSDGD